MIHGLRETVEPLTNEGALETIKSLLDRAKAIRIDARRPPLECPAVDGYKRWKPGRYGTITIELDFGES